jgi:hypothetical protein
MSPATATVMPATATLRHRGEEENVLAMVCRNAVTLEEKP